MEQKIGKITHYFDKIGVGVIALSDGELHVGATIKVKGHEHEFEQVVNAMQIDRQEVAAAAIGQAIGLKVDEPVKEGDEVFVVTD